MRDKNTVLEEFAAMASPPATLSGGGIAERVDSQLVSGNFFRTLGLNAMLGRVLTPDDDRIPNGHRVCVINYGLWVRRFGSGRDVVGRTIQINGQPSLCWASHPKNSPVCIRAHNQRSLFR
jgi:hypothetical protein